MVQIEDLDDAERDEDDEQERIEAPQAGEPFLLRLALHVVREVRGEEEGDVGRNEDRQRAPPFVDPDEGRGGGEENLEDGEECGMSEKYFFEK